MTTQAHSKIGASSMYRWSKCPGSVRLSAPLENRSSKYAEEGTEAHEHAAYRLTEGKWRDGIDPEMQEAVEIYTSLIETEIKHATRAGRHGIEHRFDLSSVYPGLFGTADAWIYDPIRKLLSVYDYKHGAGVPVEVAGNPQLMYYGLGALVSLGIPCEEVELVIVQPRCAHPDGFVRRWKLPAIELHDFAMDLIDYAKATEDPKAKLVAGDHCKFCPASGICPQMEEKAIALAKEEFSPTLSYDPAKLASVLEWLPTLESWATQVREFAYAEAQHGRIPPGWKLVAKRATRKWRNEEDIATFLETEFPASMDQFYQRSLKSPAQIEKVLHKNKHEKLKPFIEAISSGNTLAHESDPRPPSKPDALAEFSVIEEKSAIDVGSLRLEIDLFS